MKGRFLLVVLIMLSWSLQGQKVARAAQALEEKKFDKAEDLFSDLLRKDSNDLAGLIGYAFTLEKDVSKIAYNKNLETAHYLLTRARKLYPTYADFDRIYISKIFGGLGLSDLENYHRQIIDRLWSSTFLYSESIQEVTRFIREFSPYSNKSKEIYTKKLITLTFDSLMKSPSISSLEQFLKTYPRNEYTIRVSDRIEGLRYQNAIQSDDPGLIEMFIKDYPRSNEMPSVLNHLAFSIFKELEKKPSRLGFAAFIDRFKDPRFQEYPSIRGKLDTINAKIEEIDFNALSETTTQAELQTFLDSYPKGAHVTIVKERIAKLEYQEIVQERAYYKLPAFATKYPDQFFWSDSLITSLVNDTRSHVQNKLLPDFFLDVLQKEQLPSNGAEPLLKVMRKMFTLHPIIDTACMAQVFGEIKESIEDNQTLQNLLGKSCFLLDPPNIQFRHQFQSIDRTGNEDYTHFGFIELSANEKVQCFFYVEQDEEIRMNAVIRPNTNAKLFELIKARYNIRRFSDPSIQTIQNNGIITSLYGWTPTDNPCCPQYKLQILFLLTNGNLIADRAISIETSFEEIQDLSDQEDTPTVYSINDL